MERKAVELISDEPVVVGLDMSYTSTGFFLKHGDHFQMDTIKTTPRTCINELARIEHIVSEIMSRIPEKVSMICLEDFYTPQSRAQMGSAMRLVMLGTTMRLALYKSGHPFYIPAATQIKKFATGKGNCDKSIVVREVFKKWNIEAADDNQADACAMAYMALAISDFRGEKDLALWAKYQIDVVKTVVKERLHFNLG